MAQPHPYSVLPEQLFSHGTPEAIVQAQQLETLYHGSQLARLSDDVYDAAKSQGQPPLGWVRASESMEQLQGIARQVGMDAEALKELLHPERSGFRAEIYLPDPKILGPGYQPVLAFKGSAGEVRESNGSLRSTAGEDFAANNFPQSVGLKTDYYDRAMALARALNSKGFAFETTGHSLGGGMASAASAVTGVKATTFNAAGLPPETARRFAQENPGTQLFDAKERVTAYMVQGDLLSDGVQNNFSRLDVVRRELVGGTLKEVSEVLHELPQARALLQQQLNKYVPEHAQPTVNAFIQTLAEGNTRHY